MRDSTRRSLRTLAHGLIAAALAIPVLATQLPTPTGRIGEIVGTVIGFCAVITKVVNTLEDKGWMPAFLKAPASPGADPVPNPDVLLETVDAGHTAMLDKLGVAPDPVPPSEFDPAP